MHLTESSEMYLATIMILEKELGHVRVVDVAEELEVTKPSVTKAMNHLMKEGYIHKELYGNITLTPEGIIVATEVVKKRAMIVSYLERSLGLSHDEAVKNACRMEHVISEEMLQAIKSFLQEEKHPGSKN
ncbi:metal-dependent transcriptional regulator [Proteiniclasticum ruminis]|uniref:Mn-dependent transcriptional regulator, DtxR family n=1 Tax=Proteiniclasticum ruminis TaxID=398199 RepID=A0A1I4XKX7_9CLOT|nr:metal-dependent transcriptional regulator [Proteiniclasticum ruminis]SFN26494.1 Mn-dependent transcriptional regulator, DtxR family [Proteiniclasticum ruminis]